MGEQPDKILEHLEESVLKTPAGSKESIEAIKAYNEYVRNKNDKVKNDADQRLRQNIHDDEIVKNRDQALIDDKHFKHQVIMDWMDKALRIVGLTVNTALIIKAIRDDKNGEPWFGPAKDFLSNLIRRGN